MEHLLICYVYTAVTRWFSAIIYPDNKAINVWGNGV